MTTQTRLDLAALVQRHQAGVWRYLRFLGCDPATADDLTQETFLTLMRSPFEERAPEATSAYLRHVARSIYLRQAHRDRRLRPLDTDALERMEAAWQALHDNRDDGDEVQARLRECLGMLAPRAREAIDRTYGQSEPGDAVAEALGMAAGAVRVLLHRARRTLRECVERKMQSHPDS